jgi:hypothetical protein
MLIIHAIAATTQSCTPHQRATDKASPLLLDDVRSQIPNFLRGFANVLFAAETGRTCITSVIYVRTASLFVVMCPDLPHSPIYPSH